MRGDGGMQRGRSDDDLLLVPRCTSGECQGADGCHDQVCGAVIEKAPFAERRTGLKTAYTDIQFKALNQKTLDLY